MILHSTLPYWQDIPNPAIGYLKGFLEAKGVSVTNVYWNIVLMEKILDFQQMLGKHSRGMDPFFGEATAFYICRRLLTGDCNNSGSAASDLLLSSIYTEKEISEGINLIKDEIDQYIKQNNLHEPSIAGFTLKTYQWLMSLYVIRRLKELNPDINIVLGGIYNEYQAFILMKIFNRADFAIWGEGEYPLFHLANALEDGTPIKNVPYLVYRDNGRVFSTGAHNEPLPPLDSYPFADHSDYFSTLRKFLPFRKSVFIPIWGSRSCNWNKCKFCGLNENVTYRERSPENIVQEIEAQSKKHRIDSFFFVDSDIAGNKKRLRNLLTLLIQSIARRKRPYRFGAMTNPIFFDLEIARDMKRAGFREVHIGFEAVTDPLLEKMQKRHRFVHNIQALKAGNRFGMDRFGFIIIRGIPTETEEDVTESCVNLKFLRFFLHRFPPDPNIFMLFKGSPFYREMSEEEREKWKEDALWEEIGPTQLISESDRFEFFSFCESRFKNYHQWDKFGNLVKFYVEQGLSYEWIETPDGSSVKETGLRSREYTLTRDETDLLSYCDSIKNFSELTKEFSHVPEDALWGILDKLKDLGLVYYDEKGTIISVLEVARKKAAE